jgi:hypothetical protein
VILLAALVLGLLAGLGWARLRHVPYRAPDFQALWLVPVAFLPQLIIAYLPKTHSLLPEEIASVGLSASLVVFLAFVLLNRKVPGMPILLIGLTLNLLVMLVNGGWMPINPELAGKLIGGNAVQLVGLGNRFGQKDILLLPQDTHLVLLSDRFILPDWLPYQAAFSLGDTLIGLGVFWLLAMPAKASVPNKAPLE